MIAIYVVIIHNTLAKYNTINKQKLVPQKLCEKKRNNDVYCSNFFDNKIEGRERGGICLGANLFDLNIPQYIVSVDTGDYWTFFHMVLP